MWRWLESTHELQQDTYGYPVTTYGKIAMGMQILGMKELAEYMDWNQKAAVQELAEVREEFSWKPWATDPPFVNRERIIEEIVDTMHFLGNMLVGLGCDDDEFAQAYRNKQEINRARAASGKYSAKKGGLAEGSNATS